MALARSQIIYGLDLYRLAGLYSPGNGEISTPAFSMPSGPLWLNADAHWYGDNRVLDPAGVANADEGRQAYVQVAVHEVVTTTEADTSTTTTDKLIPGYSQDNCILTNVTGLKIPLRWAGNPTPIKPGTQVQLRLYFRDATVYAVGSD